MTEQKPRWTKDEEEPRGLGTNTGAVEIAEDQIGDEGASNYKSPPPREQGRTHAHDGHERDDDARGQGAQSYEAGEAASRSIEQDVAEDGDEA